MKKLLFLAVLLLTQVCFGQTFSTTAAGMFIPSNRTNIVVSNLPAASNDIWTVPAGSRAQVIRSALSGNNTSVSYYPAAKIGGIYYRLVTSASVLTNTISNISTGAFILEEGESYALVTSQAGINGTITFAIFSTNAPLRTMRDLAVDNTIRTIYTCPAGKVAYSGESSSAQITFGPNGALFLYTVNSSGGARAYSAWRVPNGSTATTNNVIVQNFSLADAASTTSLFVSFMLPGDFIQLQSNAATATQMAYVTVLEVPFP